jgi:TRAP-type C4-dicarboxylate transport system permease small subunit
LRAVLDRIGRGYLVVEESLVIVAGMFVIVMMLITMADVVMRSFFNSPLEGAYEITEFMMAGVVFLGLAYMQREKGHLAIEIFTERMPPWARSVVRMFGYLVALMLFSAIAYETTELAYEAWDIQDYTMGAARLPLWPVKSAIAFGSILFCIRLVVDMACDLTALSQPRAGR